ncbi:ROK family transcriptional regulator [Nocardioides nitrophenolicus]|uniref:ROK family transcriptional regulator n=1 Tax=Nocardioides nitrophenolicus TaxID=60489 RepID=UPI0027DBCF9D|nr:ROK family transcriptional regulator [Nocardioides nitrophenolicus]MBM7518544.1 putative NBD/HSP70 family sugar kinase [Nocardioides nitrophenolicus]
MERTTSSLRGALTADQVAVRRHNLAVVMNHLRLHGARSRARVAAETGLNKATVSSLVAELVDRGLVTEGDTERGAVGRPGRAVQLDATTYVALGVEVNIDYVSVLAMSLRGEAVAESRVPLDTANMAPGELLQRMGAVTKALLDPLVEGGASPVGLTLAVPGIVEPATGIVYDAPNLGWQETPVTEPMRELLGHPEFPILLDNEANLAALAELDVRGPDGAQELLLLTGAAGVGGGIVSGGRLLRGLRGFAGEIGHLQVDRAGQPCRCGRVGCWETVVGLNALLGLAADSDDPVRDPSVDVVQRLEDLRARAEAGDDRTLSAIDEVCGWLAAGCGSLVNIFNPEVLVLGGYFAVLGRWFGARLSEDLGRQVFAPDSGGCRVELSTLGFSAAVRGGALRATHAVLDDPTLAPVRGEVPRTSGALS